jgi:hypothetical protein
MSYTINLTDGALFATIPDGTINTTSSMTLVGKNYAGYGQFLDTNFIHLLENASNTTAPGAPLTGQLWWNSGTGILNVYNGTAWKCISGATASTTAPSGSISVAGDLWYDSTNAQLKVYTGTSWLLVGPQSSSGQGVTGAIAATITDNVSTDHVVLELYTANTIVGMVSKDATFTPGTAVPGGWGLQQIAPGITLSTSISNTTYFQGNAINSLSLGGLPANAYITSSGNISSFNGSITVNAGGGATTAIINGAGNAIGNIGSSTSYFNTIFAKATSAQYADVAERFEADVEMLPGTVVELGGSAEITLSNSELSDKVFGVISTQAAYLMNSGAGTDATHPPVAMTGRVPVRVVGQIRKGDRLVSAGNGLARSAAAGEATAFNVIGRALRDKLDTDIGTVEAIVTIK